MEETIKLSRNENFAEIWFNRPEAYNSFDLETVTLLSEVLLGISLQSDIEGVILSGVGKVFCAGGDLKWLKRAGDNYASSFHKLAAKYHQAVMEIRRMPKPVIAAVNGLAAGGGFSLALACDFRVMEKSAVLRQAYTSNGLSIDGGGTFTLPRIVGMAKALEIAAFDRAIDSTQAMKWGLATEVVEDGKSYKRGMELLWELNSGSISSFAASKHLITDSFDTTFEAQLEKERHMLSLCADGPEGREGINAFLEKRQSEYKKFR
jgi:2-(1,2-epoxy-1,2-dihydrophenyl)acetyl-CoA isomerase